jgi:DNA-binding MarR family transcriptional regulator
MKRPRSAETPHTAESLPAFGEKLAAAKQASTAQLLFRCARLLNERALARASSAFGFALRQSHTAMIPHIDLKGTRQSELARNMRVSKQAVNQLVNELVELGLLERIPDPDDGRAALVVFSKKGRSSLFDGLRVLAQIEQEMAAILGQESMLSLHDSLNNLLKWLDAEKLNHNETD